jgi:hypothetical protein
VLEAVILSDLHNHPILTWLADQTYRLLQVIDPSYRFAKLAKRGSKTFLRCARKVEEGSTAIAARLGCTALVCGHTHVACGGTGHGVTYFNSGCWTELPCTYLTVANAQVDLHAFEPEWDAASVGPSPEADPLVSAEKREALPPRQQTSTCRHNCCSRACGTLDARRGG